MFQTLQNYIYEFYYFLTLLTSENVRKTQCLSHIIDKIPRNKVFFIVIYLVHVSRCDGFKPRQPRTTLGFFF